MAKKKKLWGKGEEDLVKDSSLMLSIDDLASNDRDVSLVGGEAYVPTYNDKLSVQQVLDMKPMTDDEDSIKMSTFILGLVVGIIALLTITGIIVVILLLNMA